MTIETTKTLFSELNTLNSRVEQAQRDYELHLQSMANTLGTQFEHEGQWYQIRTRKNKDKETGEVLSQVTYMVRLKSHPAYWKGRKLSQDSGTPGVVESVKLPPGLKDLPGVHLSM